MYCDTSGPPCTGARYEVLRTCIAELLRAGVVRGGAVPLAWDAALATQSLAQHEQPAQHDDVASSTRLLLDVAAACEGASGRLLRKLPLLTHAAGGSSASNVCVFLECMRAVAAQEAAERTMLHADHLAG